MNMKFSELNLSNLVFFQLCLIVVCLFGDYCLQIIPMTTQNSTVTTEEKKSNRNWKFNLWIRAFVDSLTHGLVGLVSWAIVINFSLKWTDLLSIMLSFVIAVSIDIDHFFAVKSFNVEDALNLSERPPFHSSTLILIASTIAWIIGHIPKLYSCKIFSLMVLSSGLSHHIRDGARRGLWFPPVGSTPPLSYILYIVMITLLPLLIRFIYSYTQLIK